MIVIMITATTGDVLMELIDSRVIVFLVMRETFVIRRSMNVSATDHVRTVPHVQTRLQTIPVCVQRHK